MDSTSESGPSPNRYCSRLSLSPVPRVEDAAGRRGVKLFHLVVVALLEHGAPMELDALVERLRRADVSSPSGGDLRTAVLKAWHGMPPVLRDREGRFELDLHSNDLDLMLFHPLRLRDAKYALAARPAPIEPAKRADEERLTVEELTEGLRDADAYSISTLRLTAAVLDAHARPMRPQEVNDFLDSLTKAHSPVGERDARYWTHRLVKMDEGGLLHLLPESDLAPVRRIIRTKLSEARRRATESAARAADHEEWKARHDRDRAAKQASAARLRRAILHLSPGELPTAGALLEPDSGGPIHTFAGPEEIAVLRERVAAYDVLACVDARDSVRRLGLDPDDRRLIELAPRQRTKRFGRETLTLDVDRMLRSLAGPRASLTSAQRITRALAAADTIPARRLLAGDVALLFVLYRYMALHRGMLLAHRGMGEILPIAWPVDGELHWYDLLDDARKTGTRVEVVLGPRPFYEPWSSVRVGRVVGLQWGEVTMELDDGTRANFHRMEFHGVRPLRPARLDS